MTAEQKSLVDVLMVPSELRKLSNASNVFIRKLDLYYRTVSLTQSQAHKLRRLARNAGLEVEETT